MSTQVRTETPVFLSVAEAALRLGVNAATVRKWVHDGTYELYAPAGNGVPANPYQ